MRAKAKAAAAKRGRGGKKAAPKRGGRAPRAAARGRANSGGS